ncbi:MAG: glycosyltransferase family 2 protein [Longicatena sp.]
MMNDGKILSIIIPVYNAEKYIDKLILSLQNSKYVRLIEIICVDDGSQDSSLNIMEELKHKLENLIVLHQENQGVSVARNSALEKAVGKYIFFIDADDEINIKEFDKTLKSIVKDDADFSIFGITDVFYCANGKIKKRNNYTCDRTYDEIGFFEDFGRILNKHILYSPCNKIYKREIINEHHLKFDIDYKLGEDMLFNIAYLYYVKKTVMYNNYIYLYRHDESRNDSGSTRFYDNEKEILFHIIDEIKKLLENKQVFQVNETFLDIFTVRKLSQLLNHAYAKNSPFTKQQKYQYIENLYVDEKVKKALNNPKVAMEEVDQKLLLVLHRHHIKKGVDLLYKIRNH